jgi:hypothetical protein
MAQLKKDEWPADDERTTTENQVTNQAPDSPPAPPTDMPHTEAEAELSNTRPDDAVD